MSESLRACADCREIDRRGFIGAVAGGVAAFGSLDAVAGLAGDTAKKPAAKPAEALIRELHSTLSTEQKTSLVYDWDHGVEANLPTRLRMVNAPHFNKRIGDSYTKPQQELCLQILKAMANDDEGFRKISRNGTFDGSKSFEGLGAVLFGDPAEGKFSFVFSGHHLTIRCDGNSQPATAFGGPMYYGHSVHGYNPNNAYFFQTKGVLDVYGALDEKQRKQAVVSNATPGEQYGSVQFRAAGQSRPGIALTELSGDQKALVEHVMRDLLSPYRQEDADEVMSLIKTNGGMEKIHLAYYKDAESTESNPWDFWRLEGPGFVWNYRVLPHVHCFVQIAQQA